MSVQEHDIATTLQELKEEFGLTDQELEQFVSAEVSAGSSALRSTGLKLGGIHSIDSRAKVTRIPAVFDGKLSGDAQLKVRKMYPDFEVTFTQEKHQAHAMAACCRMLDRMLLKKRAPGGLSLMSIGGNYEHELLHSDCVVHSCTPHHSLVCDVKEAAREVQRMSRLRGRLVSPHTSGDVKSRISQFLVDPSPWRCDKLAQDCDHPAAVVMMSHVYDMSLEDVVRTMISHGSKLVLGCMLFSNQMLVEERGSLSFVDGYYYHDGDYVHYGFNRESQWQYKHKWSQLRRYGFGGTLVQVGDRQAFYSITERRGDTIYYTLSLMPRASPPVPVKLNWRVGEKKRAVVKGYTLSNVDRTTVKRALVRSEFSYPYEAFVKVLSYAIERMDKGSFSLEDLQRKTRAVFADTTINSVRVTGFDRLDDDQMAYFLSNVGILAAMATQKSGLEERSVIERILTLRVGLTAGLIRKSLLALRIFLKQPFPNRSTVHIYWRRFIEHMDLASDDMLNNISWEVDMGYRSAVSSDLYKGDLGLCVPGVPPAQFLPGTDNTRALLMSAAAQSPEMAAALAHVASKIYTHPKLEAWATELQQQLVISNDDASRKAEAKSYYILSDPNLENPIIPPSGADEGSAFAGTSDTLLDQVVVAKPVEGDVDPKSVAKALGVDVDASDEASCFPITQAQYNEVANASIAEAIVLIEESEKKLLGELLKNFESVTVDSLPDEYKLRSMGKLNYNPDFWYVDAGVISARSWSNRLVRDNERQFPYAAVYVPSKQAIVRITTNAIDSNTFRHKVVEADGSLFTGLVMVTDALVIYNGPVILSNMVNALSLKLPDDFSLSFVEGVPGCGKTHYIIHTVPANGVIIACGRENADATRDRVFSLAEERRDVGLDELAFVNPMRNIRTLDSALMRPSNKHRSTMFLDECFQDHAGKFWACIKLWRVQSVQALGDSKQIPYIDRSYSGKCNMPMLSHWQLRVAKYVTRRCPRDAAMAVAAYYEYKIRSTSQISASLQLALDVVDVPNLDGWKYLTMYQEDKSTLLKRGFKDVNTVAEVQGQTYAQVALVRIQERRMNLFDSPQQVDVALTRHTEKFIYYAPDSRGDLVETLIKSTYKNIALIDKFGDVSTAGRNVFDV